MPSWRAASRSRYPLGAWALHRRHPFPSRLRRRSLAAIRFGWLEAQKTREDLMKLLLWTLLCLGVRAAPVSAQQPAVTVGTTDMGGVVSGPNGPEAGVWVIAETNDLGTKFARIVVTDDQGRYLIPDLPRANYDVWVRGYGLVDS